MWSRAPRRAHRSPSTVLLSSALFLLACGHPAIPTTTGADTVAAVAAPEDSTRASVDTTGTAPATTLALSPAAQAFPHGEHRRIECTVCHQNIPGHGTHRQIACRECHGAPGGYATLPVRSTRDCMACHHAPERGLACTHCHSSARLGAFTVSVPVRTTVRSGEVERQLPFDHARHERLECRQCHTTAVTNARGTPCSACHEQHHQPDRQCGTCHRSVPRDVHVGTAHRGCGGQGCHGDAAVAALPPVRNVCLVCHTDRVDHEPGRECADCHMVQSTWRRSQPPEDRR